MKAVKVTADGTVPFNAKTRTVIGQLPKGTYVIVPSATPDGKGIYYNMKNDRWRNFFTVSDISVMTLACPDATSRVFVVEGLTGRPIEGATVKVYTNENYRVGRQLAATLTTGKDGSVTVKEKRFEIEASHDGSVWKNRTRLYNNSSATPDTILRQHVQILADRSIYHPGDSISAAVIAYSARNFEMSLSSASEISLRLLDANGKEIASQSLMTDSFGRASTDFIIPEQGLLGSWRLTAADRDGKMLGSCWLQVADYVAPTFFITTDHSEGDINPGDTVTVKGQVITYSGMPLADATVNYSVVYNPPMRWFADGGATYDSSVKTDSEGRFIISLPTSNLKGTQFERGIFTVNITATSAAGETQSGPTERFGIGQEYHIIFPSQDMNLEISDSIPALTFFVTDMLGRKIRKQLNYRLIDSQSNTAIAEGSFESPSLILPAKDYISAKYDLEVSLAEDPEVKTDAEVTLWKKTDNIAPAGTGLWIPQRVVKARPGSKTVDVTVGSGVNDRWIPAVLSGNDKVLSVEWLHIESSNVSISVEAPTGDTPYSLSLKSISDLMQQDGTIEIQPSESKSLEIKTLSFRDKISAGDDEQWSFLFSRTGVGVKDMPVLAVMTDASLNALYPFDWSFAPLSRRGDNFYSMRLYSAHSYNQVNALKAINYLSVSHIANPDINDYGQGWGIGYHGMNFYANGLMSRSAVSRSFLMKSEAKMSMADVSPEASGGSVEMIRGLEDGVTVETVEEAEEALSYADSSDGAGNGISATYELRETECPVAFFKPYLTTDSDGVVTIDFTVPNFNTTWALQVLGYDESLQTAKVALEAVASKPVMVSTHAPRFVRTGDEIMLTATIFNNTGDECPAGARIELVDLVSGKIIKAKDFAAENLAASASRVVSMSWTVASDVSSVGFRAYAEAAGHRDGEQALVPVLPASSPVVESTPFWIIPGSEEIEVKLPGFKDTDQVTLQYCDNPAWFCLTALPDIVRPESKSITARMQALFGNVMAYNLISSNSGLRTGLEALLSDRNSQFAAMKSNLEKDGNLKITQLNNTPWVNSAESETLRMSRLSTLLDDKGAQTVINDLIDEIRQMQTPEGGWSWCPDMEPSSYITRDVLRHFGMMARADALKKFGQTEAMIKKGIRYVDSETVKDYRKYHKKDESLSYLLDWLYVRSSFPAGYISDHDMTSLARKAEKDIAAEWKEMGIGAKAKAAVVLWRAGNRRVASEILESLRQYASYSPEKGMWYDNIGSGWGGMSALQTTTLVLEAYAEIQPANENIDRLRQWLILGRQVQDWGRNSRTVETVDAILTSGSDWTQAKAAVTPEFYIKGKRINIPETAALTGSFTLTLNAKDASKKTLKICRQGASPAWGGVIAQYEAPIMEVVPSEVPELSIRKNVVALVEGKDGSLVAKEGVTLKKGMLVRVTLTITAGRDMDYVAVTDERSACLEPTQQLSGYTWSDGTGFYREVRDSSTNLFFGWLPKGHHVVSYDCRVSQEGEFSCGIATAQSQYSPLVTAHSAGAQLNVE